MLIPPAEFNRFGKVSPRVIEHVCCLAVARRSPVREQKIQYITGWEDPEHQRLVYRFSSNNICWVHDPFALLPSKISLHHKSVCSGAKDTDVQSQDTVILIRPEDCGGTLVTWSRGECLCRTTIRCFLSQNCWALCLNKHVCVFGTACAVKASLKGSLVRHQQEGSWSWASTDGISVIENLSLNKIPNTRPSTPDLYPYSVAMVSDGALF